MGDVVMVEVIVVDDVDVGDDDVDVGDDDVDDVDDDCCC